MPEPPTTGKRSRRRRRVREKPFGHNATTSTHLHCTWPTQAAGHRAESRKHRPLSQRCKRRKRQKTTSPSVTHARGENSGSRGSRVCGQEMQACTPAWGWKDILTGICRAADRRSSLTGTYRFHKEGIG
ncbi:Hypothetical predicted protein [Pelobates cultripes]|uniref:Uncharacterized protein n=1 Tax=Pelobates cultripes TaxID=61616 RepID=A0AAD1SHY4_PELCU|nr:Hypothetical predicted protein [Pelobates cultripes]